MEIIQDSLRISNQSTPNNNNYIIYDKRKSQSRSTIIIKNNNNNKMFVFNIVELLSLLSGQNIVKICVRGLRIDSVA